MITPKVTENKVVFGPCRLSYTHVFNKYNPDGDDKNAKYMTNIGRGLQRCLGYRFGNVLPLRHEWKSRRSVRP